MNLKNFLANLPRLPGVYSMQDQSGSVIYIGKAKDLKARIKTYFVAKTGKNADQKTIALVAEIANIEITITQNETEALLLENKLINQLKPKYNILFKDDKSYPYILISNEIFPSVKYWRGKTTKNIGTLYGPYPNTKAVRVSLDLLYKIFKLRSCDPVTFKNRVRPCLEYQIKRCSAPCVGYITPENYNKDLANVKLFLQAKSKLLLKKLKGEMQQAAKMMDYELAAKLRDQIKSLSVLQHEQAVLNKTVIDVDVIGIAVSPKLICIHLLRIRQGDLLYSRQFLAKNQFLMLESSQEEFLSQFILQNYGDHKKNTSSIEPDLPLRHEILTAIKLNDAAALSEIIKIKITHAVSGDKLTWQNMAQTSAEEALASRVLEYRKQKNNFKLLTNVLGKTTLIDRIVCFDISHTQGKETVAACVVFNIFGKETTSYRCFNVNSVEPGDDYAALDFAISKYLTRVFQGLELAPNLLIIDGGKGQLKVGEDVLAKFKEKILAQKLDLSLLAIAKGKARIWGEEKFYLTSTGDQLSLPATSAVIKLLQKIRDYTHNFAITRHRRKRDRLIKT